MPTQPGKRVPHYCLANSDGAVKDLHGPQATDPHGVGQTPNFSGFAWVETVLAAAIQCLAIASDQGVASATIAHAALVDALESFEQIHFALRIDRGHTTKHLNERELLRLCVSDLDEAFDGKPDKALVIASVTEIGSNHLSAS
jgi:hypothetical protein